ncbi:MAG TPA: FAD-binding oxidoreductase [Bryobacteraceae bacterium]
MNSVTPSSVEELASILQEAAANRHTIETMGQHSKLSMGGPIFPADTMICTAGLKQVLQYEPNDLTVSVEAGIPFAELQTLLAKNRQMIALDPPFAADATVGEIVSTNSSGPLRRAFGTARDLLIGMRFATLDGRLVSAGGMVVKNVAGLDMGKLLIGSFGTLGVIASLNFRLHPLPEETETFLFSFPDLDSAMEKRDAINQGALLPLAVDLISPGAADRLGSRGFVLSIRAGGSRKVLARYAKELNDAERLTGQDDIAWWRNISEFSADFLRREPGGIVLRISSTISDMASLLRTLSGATISRASSGVTYAYLTSDQNLNTLWKAVNQDGRGAVVEYAPAETRESRDLWQLDDSPRGVDSFAIMKKVKQMFDPHGLLNRSRLYGRI